MIEFLLSHQPDIAYLRPPSFHIPLILADSIIFMLPQKVVLNLCLLIPVILRSLLSHHRHVLFELLSFILEMVIDLSFMSFLIQSHLLAQKRLLPL